MGDHPKRWLWWEAPLLAILVSFTTFVVVMALTESFRAHCWFCGHPR